MTLQPKRKSKGEAKLTWPYPAPGHFAQWDFRPLFKSGGTWQTRHEPEGREPVTRLEGSIRKNKFTLIQFATRDKKGVTLYFNSLRKAEAAYIGYLLTGELTDGQD